MLMYILWHSLHQKMVPVQERYRHLQDILRFILHGLAEEDQGSRMGIVLPRLVHFIFEGLFSFLPRSSQVPGFYTKPVDSPAPADGCFLSAHFFFCFYCLMCLSNVGHTCSFHKP